MEKKPEHSETVMLSDESIRAAARIIRGADAMVKSYLESNEPDHTFSPEFEQKMQRLINCIGEDSSRI